MGFFKLTIFHQTCSNLVCQQQYHTRVYRLAHPETINIFIYHITQLSYLMSMHFFHITINLWIIYQASLIYINSCFKTTQPYCCDTCTLNIKANKLIVHFVPENKISDKPPTRKPCSWAPLRIV